MGKSFPVLSRTSPGAWWKGKLADRQALQGEEDPVLAVCLLETRDWSGFRRASVLLPVLFWLTQPPGIPAPSHYRASTN